MTQEKKMKNNIVYMTLIYKHTTSMVKKLITYFPKLMKGKIAT